VQLYLIRHTRLQAEGICYGRHDPPLADSFAADAQALAAQLADLPIMPVYCSPALRCRRLAEQLGWQPQYDARLLELDFGDWEARAWADIPRHESEVWTADFVRRTPPNGESYAALQIRVVEFLRELQKQGAEHAAIVSHAGVIRAALAWLRNIPLEHSFQRISVDYGEVIIAPFP
jgi:alpha-ribazole phosphatase